MTAFFRKNPLFLIFLLPIVVDVVGTVFGQPPEYWTSGYQVFNEALPIYPLLQIHPLLFVIVCLGGWLSFTYWLTVKLREPFNIWATMSLLIGHGYNSVAWLRINQNQAGILSQTDQFTQSLSLLPMTVYILCIGFIATKGWLLYLEKRTE